MHKAWLPVCTIDCVSVKEKWTPSKNDLGNIADVCRHIIMIKFIPGIYVYSCNEVSATSDEATMNLRRHLNSMHILQLFILICS